MNNLSLLARRSRTGLGCILTAIIASNCSSSSSDPQGGPLQSSTGGASAVSGGRSNEGADRAGGAGTTDTLEPAHAGSGGTAGAGSPRDGAAGRTVAGNGSTREGPASGGREHEEPVEGAGGDSDQGAAGNGEAGDQGAAGNGEAGHGAAAGNTGGGGTAGLDDPSGVSGAAQGGTAGTGTISGGGEGGVIDGGGAAGTPSGGQGPGEVCIPPGYSSDCSQVPSFQCGFTANCLNGVITAEWHVHTLCGGNGNEIITRFSCTYACPGECSAVSYFWPSSGEELVHQGCTGSGGGSRRVFMTSLEYPGNFGGVSTGDAICQHHADMADLGGEWRAWLSDASTSPSSTFSRPSGYTLLDAEANIAGNWTEAGLELTNPILYDETGTRGEAWFPVWTGTDSLGQTTGETCEGWTASNGLGSVGRAGYLDEWSQMPGAHFLCSGSARLYCFEQ